MSLGGISRLMNYSLYFHIPFCKKRCPYCDFNTNTGKESLIPEYIDGLIEEFRIVSKHISKSSIHSIYFGGGTPSLVPVSEFERLLKAIEKQSLIQEKCEISLEANPESVNLSYLRDLHALGFNRISFGAQSTNATDLARLGRTHTVEETLSAVEFARRAGFTNINLDLINNLPWQDLESWKASLGRAVALAPEHLSVYSLIIEQGTPFYEWHQRGLIAPQDEDLGADMFEFTMDYLEQAGYEHYEISNWAKKDPNKPYRCVHNLQYWMSQPYFGLGAGAHGFVDGSRTENVGPIDSYLQLITGVCKYYGNFPFTPVAVNVHKVDRMTRMKDFMWLALRLVKDGVSLSRFEKEFGLSALQVFQEPIDALVHLELLEWHGGKEINLKLTRRGVMVANQVFMRFI